MSLAQRRTAVDGVHTIPPTPPPESPVQENGGGTDGNTDDHDIPEHSRDRRITSASTVAASIPAEDRKEVWQALSYDPFAPPSGPELHKYESFPPETTEDVAAYEVSTTKRICERIPLGGSSPTAPPPQPPARVSLLWLTSNPPGQVAFAVLACTLASGIVCGFAALKPVLVAEGVYRSLCPADWPADDDGKVPCPEQDMRLNLFFIAASVALNVSTVLAGYVLDAHGRRACYLLAAAILFLGAACEALALRLGDAHLAAWWGLGLDGYAAGNLLLGLGGTFLFVSSYQLANAFPRRAGLVVALVTGAFDASAAVFLLYRLAYEATGGGGALRPAAFFALFALVVPPLLVAAELTGLMPRAPYTTRRGYQAALAAAQDPARDVHDSDDETFRHQPRGALARARARRASARAARLASIQTVTGDAAARRADRDAARARQRASGLDNGVSSSSSSSPRGRPVAEQMATPWFWLLLGMTALQMTRMNYFIATVRAQYRHLLGGDEAAAARVNGFFDVALPVAGVAATPLIGLLLNAVPVWATLAVLTALVVVLGVVNCIGALWAGYATVVAFVLFRPLYYSAVS